MAFLRDKLAVTPPAEGRLQAAASASSGLRSSSRAMAEGSKSSSGKWWEEGGGGWGGGWRPFLGSREQATAWDLAFFIGGK